MKEGNNEAPSMSSSNPSSSFEWVHISGKKVSAIKGKTAISITNSFDKLIDLPRNEELFVYVLLNSGSGGNLGRDNSVGVVGEGRPGLVFKPIDRGK